MLTQKQAGFCLHFVANAGNASAAYREAYNCSRMKDATVNRNAHELLKNSKIATRVRQLQAEKTRRIKERYEVDEERLIKAYAQIAFSDPAQLFDENGCLLPIDKMPEDIRMALKNMDATTRNLGEGEVKYINKIHMHDKLKALQDLGKHIGFFEKDNVQRKQEAATIVVGDMELPAWMANLSKLTSSARKE